MKFASVAGGAATITELLGPSVVSACNFPGPTPAQRISNAIQSLPDVYGGTVDARCLPGIQFLDSDPFAGIPSTKPVNFIAAGVHFGYSVNIQVPLNVNLQLEEGATFFQHHLVGGPAVPQLTIFGGMAGSTISPHFPPPWIPGSRPALVISSPSIPSIYPQWFGAAGDGLTDDTAAIQDTYAAAATAGIKVYFPAGIYLITGQITQSGSEIYTEGAGIGATQWRFQPTANATCFQVTRPTDADNTFGGIRGISITSNDSAHVKTAINLVAVSQFYVEDVAITGTATDTPGGAFYWGDATKASIGIQTNGHQAIHFNRVTVWANRPVFLGKDPFVNTQDTDLFNFENMFLVGGNAHPVVEAQQEIVVGSLFFGGYNDWIGGTDGFKAITTGANFPTAPHTRPTVRFDNCRWESGQAGHHFNIQASGGDMVYDLTIRNCVGEVSVPNGILLRGVEGAVIDRYRFFGTTGVALDLDNTSGQFSGFVFLNCAFTEQGATISTPGFLNYLNFNTTLGSIGLSTFDGSNNNGVFGGVHLINLASINALTTTAASKRLLFLNSNNAVIVDADALGTVVGGHLAVNNSAGLNPPTASPLSIKNLPLFTTNALALAGGLSVGDCYRNGNDPDEICVVH